MYTNNYEFTRINAIKLLIKNKKGKVLLIQEPETNDWMPLHWGLPGGKPTETESMLETIERKVKGDIGVDVEIHGVVRVEELLVKGRTVLMFIVTAETSSDVVSGEAKNHKWVSKEEVDNMDIKEFTEFYNKKLLTDYFEERLPAPIPLSIFKTEEYYKMDKDEEYQSWFNSGSKK